MATALQLFANNAASVLNNDISSTDTVLKVPSGKGDIFPSPTNGQYFLITLEDIVTYEFEIVRCISRSGDTFNVIRGQENTNPKSFTSGSRFELRITKGTLENLQNAAISGGQSSYLYTQTIPAKTWTIVHNMNKYPAINIFDSYNNICYTNVEYVDLNTINIYFNIDMTGKVYLS